MNKRLNRKKLLAIAKICHEINRAYCSAIGDDSQVPWEDMPTWQQNACVDGVELLLKNPETTPEQSHTAWCEKRRGAGWKFGKTKSEKTKTHPCLVDYSELPAEHRVKDCLFNATVLNTAQLIGVL